MFDELEASGGSVLSLRRPAGERLDQRELHRLDLLAANRHIDKVVSLGGVGFQIVEGVVIPDAVKGMVVHVLTGQDGGPTRRAQGCAGESAFPSLAMRSMAGVSRKPGPPGMKPMKS